MIESRRLIIGGIAALVLAFGIAGRASAAITADPDFTVLYVKGDAAANSINVECVGSLVYVNGAPAADGKASCTDLEKLSVSGFGGDDVITISGFSAGPTAELSSSGGASFLVFGGDGNDTIKGDAEGEQFSGGAGNDILSGGQALIAEVGGGPGNDALRGGLLFGILVGGKGRDHLHGSGLVTFASGGGGPDAFSGGSGVDLATGGPGKDVLTGKRGRDVLGGGGGADSLFGGAGRDTLGGGPGRDDLRGGPGADREYQGSLPKKAVEHLPGLGKLLGVLIGASFLSADRVEHAFR